MSVCIQKARVNDLEPASKTVYNLLFSHLISIGPLRRASEEELKIEVVEEVEEIFEGRCRKKFVPTQTIKKH